MITYRPIAMPRRSAFHPKAINRSCTAAFASNWRRRWVLKVTKYSGASYDWKIISSRGGRFGISAADAVEVLVSSTGRGGRAHREGV